MDVNSNGAVAGLQVATNPQSLLMVSGRNVSATDIHVQLHDSASVPANGATAILSIKVLAQENFSISYPVTALSVGRKFSNGVYICSSTTDTTKTLSATNDIAFDVQLHGAVR
jgi:hypothetical protein